MENHHVQWLNNQLYMAHFHPFSIAMLDYQRVETSAIGRFWLIRVDPRRNGSVPIHPNDLGETCGQLLG
jgi:hypothetical protein